MAIKVTFQMTDYMVFYKAKLVPSKNGGTAIGVVKIDSYDISALLEKFIKDNFSQMKAFGCDMDVKKNKPFLKKSILYINNEILPKMATAFNDDLFMSGKSKVVKKHSGNYYFNDDDTPFEYDKYYKHQKIIGIKGLVGTLHGEVDYKNTKYDITLEIRSRFDTPGKPYFLMTMLSEAMTGVLESDPENNTVKRKSVGDIEVLDVLTVYLFRKAVNTAFRNGLYRTYVRREHNDEKLRGAIDFARHIRLNYGKNSSNVAYTTRERTEDNPLNRLIAYAWEHLKRESFEAVELMSSVDSDEQAAFEMAIGDDDGKLGELYRELVENGAPADGSSCLHKISKLNNLDHFYNFAFKIPETDSDQKEADSDYKDWKQKFDESADKVFIDVLNSLVNEAERTLKIREILSQLETQPAGSE